MTLCRLAMQNLLALPSTTYLPPARDKHELSDSALRKASSGKESVTRALGEFPSDLTYALNIEFKRAMTCG